MGMTTERTWEEMMEEGTVATTATETEVNGKDEKEDK